MSFKEGTNFESKDIRGMYKVFNKQDQTSTFYKIKIENVGSENMYSEEYKLMKEKSYRPKCREDKTVEEDRGEEDY